MGKQRDNHLQNARRARALSGVGLLAQWREILALRFGESQLGASEYYFYRLFDRRLTDEDRRRFAGYRREREIDRVLNAAGWRSLANDKLIMYAALQGLGFPYPPIRAVCHGVGRPFPGAAALSTEQEIRGFLASASYPLFLKPVHGCYGQGACSAMGYEPATDSLRLGNEEFWSLQEAARGFLAPRSQGYLFQDLVRPHASIRAFCRATSSTVRVVVVCGPRGPEIFRCAWKIASGLNMSDNFVHGENGNLVSRVDVESGRVERIISAPGFEMREVSRHPGTGQMLLGFALPNWQAVRDLCLTAATAFPGLRLQSWDVALGEAGPVILEVNVEGGMDLHQLAGSRGMLEGALVETLAAMHQHR